MRYWLRSEYSFALVSAAVFALFSLAATAPAFAQTSDDDASMEDILGGFDDDAGDAAEDTDSDDDAGSEMDDILGGFDDEDDLPVSDNTEAEPQADRAWDLQGDLNFGLSASLHDHDSSTGTDYSGLQRFRTKLALQFDMDLPKKWKFRTSGYGFYDLAYEINGRHDYTSEVLDTYEYDLQLTDTYVEGSLHEQVDLKVGRQVVNWGRSETIRVLDIINPIDNREPGLVDIEDSRRSVGMARLGVFHGPWTLTVLAIPEIRYDITPAQGSDFLPDIDEFIPTDPVAFLDSLSPKKGQIAADLFAIPPGELEDPTTKTGKDFGKSTEAAVNLMGVFSGWDVSLQAALFNNDSPHFDLNDGRFEHARLWMVGTGANYTVGSWLFKAELAFTDGLEFMRATDKKSRVDAMAGIEYYGIRDVNIVFEIAERHINDFEDSMELFLDFAREDTIESALRISMNFWNDSLHFTVLGLAFGEKAQDGSIVRLSGEYDVIDALSVEAGFLLFQSGDSFFFTGAGDNDRFFAGAKYSF